MKKFSSSLLLSVFILSSSICLNGCSKGSKENTHLKENQQFTFAELKYSFIPNDEVDFKAKVTSSLEDKHIYKWNSSNNEVATISNKGILMCLKPGFTTISLTKDTDKTIYCTVIVSGIEVDSSILINPANYLNDSYRYRLIDSSGDTSSWEEAKGREIIEHITFSNSKAVIDYKYTISGEEYKCRNYTDLIKSYQVTSVHDIKNNIIESDDIIHLHGIVVKSYYEGSSDLDGYVNPEILIKSADSNYDEYIGVTCPNMGLMTSTNYMFGLSSGDEVIIDVKVVQPNMYSEWKLLYSDYGKRNIVLQNNNIIVFNSGKDYSLNVNNAINISTVGEFAYYMNRTNDRLPALYKLFKFSRGSRYTLDADSKAIMIGLDSNSNSDYSYYYDSIIAAFYIENQKYTLSDNKTYKQLLFGDEITLIPDDYESEQFKSDKEVYAMYVGGRGTYMPYHNFVIFGEEYVK